MALAQGSTAPSEALAERKWLSRSSSWLHEQAAHAVDQVQGGLWRCLRHDDDVNASIYKGVSGAQARADAHS